jgi:hypothetical protein
VTAAEAVFFPLDKQLNLKSKHWSEGVVKLMTWLSGIVDYRRAQEILERVGQISTSDSSVRRQAQVWGTEFQRIMEEERIRANVLVGRWGEPCTVAAPKGRMGIAMDGGMIHIRKEGWKELKIGCVFDVEVSPTLDRETGQFIELAHAVRNSYTAHLGGPETFGQMAWAEAARRGWEGAADTQVIGDGAAWIWNLAAEHFYDSRQGVDWYHAVEHLANANRLLNNEGTRAAKRWLNAQKTVLFGGHADRIARLLNTAASDLSSTVAEELHKEAGYFRKNQHRMQYQEMREDGWAIGSGMVESGAKQFKARFCGPGMRWSRDGAEKLVPVRASIMSGRFDAMWDAAYNSPLN